MPVQISAAQARKMGLTTEDNRDPFVFKPEMRPLHFILLCVMAVAFLAGSTGVAVRFLGVAAAIMCYDVYQIRHMLRMYLEHNGAYEEP